MKKNVIKISKVFGGCFLPLILTVLTGCSKDTKVSLIYGDLNAKTVEDITYTALKTKASNEENFLLAVEPASPCVCWRNFNPLAESLIKEKHVIIYHIKSNLVTDDRLNLNIKEGYTSFYIFENGKVKYSLTSDKEDRMEDLDAFKKYVDEKVTYPTYFYVSLDDIKSYYHKEQKSVIYFARSTCSDCTYVDNHFLKEYALNHRDSNPLYILDTEKIGIREYDEEGHLTPESQEKWNKFKNDYGLSNVNNPDFGYNTGVTPTFLLLNGDQDKTNYLSGSVYLNDSITEQDGNYVISDSYYTGERAEKLQYLSELEHKVLKGIILSRDDVNVSSYISWKKDKAASYHDKFLGAFLDYALPEVTNK